MKKLIYFLFFIILISSVSAYDYSIDLNDTDYVMTSDNMELIFKNKVQVESDTLNYMKFGINYTGVILKQGYYCTEVKTKDEFQQINELTYIINGKKLYFDPYNGCTSDVCDKIAKIELKNSKKIDVCSKDIYLDPQISDWNNGSQTAYYKFQENDITQELLDQGQHANNHNGTLTQGAEFTEQYTSGLYAGDYAFNATGNTTVSNQWYYNLDNDADFGGGTSVQVSFVFNTADKSEDEKRLIDFSSELKLEIRNGEWGYTYDSVAGSDGSMFHAWYSHELDMNQWHNVSFVYNGSHCYLEDSDYTKFGIDTSCSGTMKSVSLARIGSNQWSYNGSIACLGIWSDSYLTKSATESFFQDCWDRGDPPPPPDSQANINITGVTNITNNKSIYVNYSYEGNYTKSLYYINQSNIANSSNTYYNYTGLGNNTAYNISIWAWYNSTVYYIWNGSITTSQTYQTPTTEQNQTPTVTNLINQSQNNHSVFLDWDDITVNTYIIYQDNVNIANTSAGSQYNVTGLTPDTTICFNVSGYNTNYTVPEGNRSNTICTKTYANEVTPPPAASLTIDSFTCTVVSNTSLRLNWTYTGNLTYFYLVNYTGSTQTELFNSTGLGYLHENLLPNSIHYYNLTAVYNETVKDSSLQSCTTQENTTVEEIDFQEEFQMLAIFILLLGTIYLLFYFGSLLGSENMEEEAAHLDWVQPLKLLINLIALFLIVGTLGLGLKYITVLGINSQVIEVFTILFIAVCFIVLPVVLVIFVAFVIRIQTIWVSFLTSKKSSKGGGWPAHGKT